MYRKFFACNLSATLFLFEMRKTPARWHRRKFSAKMWGYGHETLRKVLSRQLNKSKVISAGAFTQKPTFYLTFAVTVNFITFMTTRVMFIFLFGGEKPSREPQWHKLCTIFVNKMSFNADRYSIYCILVVLGGREIEVTECKALFRYFLWKEKLIGYAQFVLVLKTSF